MKKIFLIGDSIRCGAPNSPGYGWYVKDKLAEVAEVYAPADNCQWAHFTLEHLREWAAQCDAESIDVVHWNNGLWEISGRPNEPWTRVSCEDYIEHLRAIYLLLRELFPNAKIIFALTTSIIEEGVDYSNADIERYNAAAKALMEELGVVVNDLYTVTKAMDASLHVDHLHFGEEGSRLLCDIVAEKVMSV